MVYWPKKNFKETERHTDMMVDCHMHMVLDGVYWRSAIDRHRSAIDIPYIHKALQQYRDRGFTYLRDGGDRWGVGAAARKIAPEYGITYRTPLAPLCMAGHYGSFIGEVYHTLPEYAALVRQHKAAGADFIKIMISGLMDFHQFGKLTEDPLPPHIIKELIHIAHEEGLSVMAHANGASAVEAAAAGGIDSIEHGAYLDRDALCAMVSADAVWVPTLSTVGNLRGTGRYPEAAVTAILENALENVTEFTAMGGLLAPGTDAGAWAVPHGSMTEYALFQTLFGENTDAVLSPGINTLLSKF